MKWLWVLLFVPLAAGQMPEPLFTDPEGDVTPAANGADGPDPAGYPPAAGLDIINVAVGPDTPEYLHLWFQVQDQSALEAWTPVDGIFVGGAAVFDFDFEPSWTEASMSARAVWDGDWQQYASSAGSGFSYGIFAPGDVGADWVRIDVPRHLIDDPRQGSKLADIAFTSLGTPMSVVNNCGTTASCDDASSGVPFMFQNHTSGGLSLEAELAGRTATRETVQINAENVGLSWRFAFDETTRSYDISYTELPGWTVDAPASITLAEGSNESLTVRVSWMNSTPQGSYPITFQFKDEARIDEVTWTFHVTGSSQVVRNETGEVIFSDPSKESPGFAPAAIIVLMLVALLRRR